MSTLFDTTILNAGEELSQPFFIENTEESPGNAKIRVSQVHETVNGLTKNITVTISDDVGEPKVIYGPATFEEFAQNGYILLSPIDSHEQKTFQIAMKTNTPLEDQFQEQRLSFDLQTGVEVPTSGTLSSPIPLPTTTVLGASTSIAEVSNSNSAVQTRMILSSPSPSPILSIAKSTDPSTPSILHYPLGPVVVLIVCFLCFLLILQDYLRHRQDL